VVPLKRIFSFLLLMIVGSCIDPYYPVIKNYNSILVVEGLITNENCSYIIRLQRTTKEEDATPEKVTDTNVYIIDEEGITTDLKNCYDGYYKTDSTSFTGVVGQKYTLLIHTSDGKDYKSEECTLLPVAGIDKLYYEKGEETFGNTGESYTGLKILLNSADATGMNQYFRWTFDEVWKFNIPYPQQYTFAHLHDTTYYFESLPVIENICWKKNQSTDILTNSIISGVENNINKQQIQFIAPITTDRITRQYSILVKQYSISAKEFDFWENLKKTGESGGDIFATQPYLVISNIHNVNNKNEEVLGYFEVSSVSQKRIFITEKELYSMDLPNYKSDCEFIEKGPDDFPGSQMSYTDIYHMYTDKGYTFVWPEVKDGTVVAGTVYERNLRKLVFTKPACAICESTGFAEKPDFWIDLE
jgi:hypothetical protein